MRTEGRTVLSSTWGASTAEEERMGRQHSGTAAELVPILDLSNSFVTKNNDVSINKLLIIKFILGRERINI